MVRQRLGDWRCTLTSSAAGLLVRLLGRNHRSHPVTTATGRAGQREG